MNMRKIMIVDDEIIVRIGFQSCLNWEEYGCQVQEVCESTEEAIACIQKEVPDIVFTDIMMPGKNGIELVRHIRTNYPYIKVVVLSCMGDIEYVKQAIRLGAEDYILKLSFTKDIMEKIVKKLCDDLEKEEKQRTQENPKEYTKIQTINREETLRTCLSSRLSIADCEEVLEQLGYYYDPFEVYDLGCFLIDRNGTTKRSQEYDRHLFQYGLLNMIREYFGGNVKTDLTFTSDNEIMMIQRYAAGKRQEIDLKNTLHQLNEVLKTHFNLTVSLGVNVGGDSRIIIPEYYEKANRAAQLRFFDGKESFHETEAAVAGQESDEWNDTLLHWKFPAQIQEAVFSQDEKKALALTGQWFEELAKKRKWNWILPIRRLVVESWIVLSGQNCNIPDLIGREIEEESYSTEAFWEAETLLDLEFAFEKGVSTILRYLKVSRSANPDIVRLITYLKEHMAENISLEQAANFCALGKSQFCVLFKKQTGDTFLNYFNSMKMRRAYELLTKKNIQVQEAAEQIGIQDLSYFSRIFKKYYTLSPSEVKKSKNY